MKNVIKSLLLVASIFLVSCRSTTVNPRTYIPIVKDVQVSNLADIEIFSADVHGVFFKVTNNSKENVEIVWNDTLIAGSRVFVEGQKSTDAGKYANNEIILPNSEKVLKAYPASHVRYGRGWYQLRLDFPTKLMVKVKKGNQEDIAMFDIDRAVKESVERSREEREVRYRETDIIGEDITNQKSWTENTKSSVKKVKYQ